MLTKLKNKLNQIQESEESVKKKWFIIMSTLSMIIIIVIWVFLFNNSIKIIGKADVENQSNGDGFWQTFNLGLKSIGGSGWNEIKDLYSHIIGEMFIEVKQ